MAQKLLVIITNKCNNATVGSIYYHQKRLACDLRIYSIEGLKYFIFLVNGKLRTPKAYQISLIINWLNEKHESNIKKLPRCLKALCRDAWLAGFIDADGSFAIRQTFKSETAKNKRNVSLYLFSV